MIGVIAVEGLPGSGKTTMIRQLASMVDGARVVEEVIVKSRGVHDESFFVENDLLKSEIVSRANGRELVLLDRYWISTACYIASRENCMPDDLALGLQLRCEPPTAWVYVDDPGSLVEARAQDGDWPNFSFRKRFRSLAIAQLSRVDQPSRIVSSADPAEVASWFQEVSANRGEES